MARDLSGSACGDSDHWRPRASARARRLASALIALALVCAAAAASVARAEEAVAPSNTAPPTISREGASEGITPTPAIEAVKLTATSGSWSGTAPISYSYRWLSCTAEEEGCTAIAGATSSTFTPTSAYLGRALKVEVTAENSAGTATAAAWSSEVRAIGGDAVAFGVNSNTELGAGYRDTREDQPVQVIGLSGITQALASEEFSLLLLNNGTVRSFGENDFSQLGDGVQGSEGENWSRGESYVTVTELNGVKTLASSNDHVMALLENGTVKTWGNNEYGQIGNGTVGASHARPSEAPGLSKAIAIAAGGGSDYALLSNHTVMAWGENEDGHLGIGEGGGPVAECLETHNPCEPNPHLVGAPVLNEKGEVVEIEKGDPEVTPLTHVVAIAAGENMAFALLEDGHVMAWGNNLEGQLGDGAKEGTRVNLTPQEVKLRSGEPLTEVASISAGSYFGLALLKDGDVDGWGRDGASVALGELEEHETCAKSHACVKAAVQVKGLEDVTAISGGEEYGLALVGASVYGWGANEQGELGDGGLANTPKPKLVKGIGSVAEISAGGGIAGEPHSLALLADGVEPPAPLLSIEPGPHSLDVTWNLTLPEYEVKYRERKAEECEEPLEGVEPPPEECKPAEWLGTFKLKNVSGDELTGLVAEIPYLVSVKAHKGNDDSTIRYIVGKPLP